ncbi:MAG: hypothetical protein M3433_02480 [Actinomycetota bacterium]|nr:hypothetical protein [Actinomycetota bacterium]
MPVDASALRGGDEAVAEVFLSATAAAVIRAAIMAGDDERDFIRVRVSISGNEVRGVCAVRRNDDSRANAGHVAGVGGLTCGGHGCSGSCSLLVTAGIVATLLTSEMSGTGAENVGESGPERAATPAPRERERSCDATESNPGGTNNYIPDAPERRSLGSGFVITGLVRSAAGCRPLQDVRVQVWLATETGGEQDNRASVRTDAEGSYRIETAPTVPQFGEPNIHVGYDDGDYGEVFIRRVVDLDDERAVVDLTLAPRG